MKKTIAICFLLCILISLCGSLCGCDPTWYTYNDFDLSDVTKVELVYYHFEDATVYNYIGSSTKKILPFDFEKMEIIETLSNEKKEEFLKDLAPLQTWSAHHADSPSGFSLLLTYSDNSFMIISVLGNFVCRYNAQGKILDVIGEPVASAGYYALIRKYFDAKI